MEQIWFRMVWNGCRGKVIHNVGPYPQLQVGSLFIGFSLSTIVILTVIIYFFLKSVFHFPVRSSSVLILVTLQRPMIAMNSVINTSMWALQIPKKYYINSYKCRLYLRHTYKSLKKVAFILEPHLTKLPLFHELVRLSRGAQGHNVIQFQTSGTREMRKWPRGKVKKMHSIA